MTAPTSRPHVDAPVAVAGSAPYIRKPFGVWGFCEYCQHDAWVVVVERDWMDEPVTEACGGGCINCAACESDDDWYGNGEPTR